MLIGAFSVGPAAVIAQTLNLGPSVAMPTTPSPALDHAVSQLQQAINAMPSGADASPGDELQRRYREFVLALLLRARDLDTANSMHTLAGFTLARTRSIRSFDSLVERLQAEPQATRTAFEAAVTRLPIRAVDIPAEPEALDAFLQHTLAPIAAADAPHAGLSAVGWIRTEPKVALLYNAPRPAPPTAATPLLVPESVTRAIDVMRHGDARSESNEFSRLREACVLAARGVWEPLPTWIPPARQELLRRMVQDHIEHAAAAPAGSFDSEPFCRAGLLVALAARVTDRKDVPPRLSREARELTLRIIGGESTSKNPSPPLGNDAVVIILRAIESTSNTDPAPIESTLVRELRPLHRALVPARDAAIERAIAAAVANASSGAGPSDPAFLAAVNALSGIRADLRTLAEINARLVIGSAQNTPRLADDAIGKKLAARLLKLGQLMHKHEQREGAVAALRALVWAVQPTDLASPEAALRNALADDARRAIWHAASADHADTLLANLDTIRAELARAGAEHIGDPSDTTHLRPLIDSLELGGSIASALRAAARVAQHVGWPDASPPARSADAQGQAAGASIQYWPGWELDAQAVSAMLDGAPDRLARMITVFDRRDDAAARAALAEFTRDYAFVLLFAKLEDHASRAGVMPIPGYIELAASPIIYNGPASRAALGDVWLHDKRQELARICRQVADYAAATLEASRTTDEAHTDWLRQARNSRDYANTASLGLLPIVASQRPAAAGWCPAPAPTIP